MRVSSGLFLVALMASLVVGRRVVSNQHDALQERAGEAQDVADVCDGLDNCKAEERLDGGSVGDPWRATYNGKEVLIKQDTAKNIAAEARPYQELKKHDWSRHLGPELFEVLPTKLVIEFLPSHLRDLPDGNGGKRSCGWTTVGKVALADPKDAASSMTAFLKSKEVSFTDAARYWRDVVVAVATLKQPEHGWQHCDLQPHNIMVDTCGDHSAKLIDWIRARNDGGQCPQTNDIGKLVVTFAMLFFDVGTQGLFAGRKLEDAETLKTLGESPKNPCSMCKDHPLIKSAAEVLMEYKGEKDVPKQAEGMEKLLTIAKAMVQGKISMEVESPKARMEVESPKPVEVQSPKAVEVESPPSSKASKKCCSAMKGVQRRIAEIDHSCDPSPECSK